MNQFLTNRLARFAGSPVRRFASTLITFTGLQLIANYALPAQGTSSAMLMAAATQAR